MLNLEQLTEKSLQANFTEVQQRHFDRLMSELEVISGGLGFAELKAKAEAGSKEALQVMRDYIVKKEQIVEFLEIKKIPNETKSAEELCMEFRGEPVKVAHQRLHALMETSAYMKGHHMFRQGIDSEVVSRGYSSKEQMLGKIVAHMAGDGILADSLTNDIQGTFYDRSMRLFKANDRFTGLQTFDANTQFLSVVAFMLEGKTPAFELAKFSDRLKDSELYNNDKNVWNRRISPDGVLDGQLYADDYLIEILANYFLGKTEEVEKLYKEMAERQGGDFWGDGIVLESPEADISINERSKDLLLAIITQAL
ncbi:hypothetical protein HOL46_03165, partial [Candidatus Falkowbacteria bacterium]|nr:hypothetical protein [Candidatus Falkowbacteria bacterium]